MNQDTKLTPTSERLWKTAYDVLKEREPKLSEAYERNLTPDEAPFHDQARICQAIKDHLDDRENKQWIFSLGKRPIKIREHGEKALRFIAWSNDLVKAAVASEPHAALAWSGVALILPVSSMVSRTGMCSTVTLQANVTLFCRCFLPQVNRLRTYLRGWIKLHISWDCIR